MVPPSPPKEGGTATWREETPRSHTQPSASQNDGTPMVPVEVVAASSCGLRSALTFWQLKFLIVVDLPGLARRQQCTVKHEKASPYQIPSSDRLGRGVHGAALARW